MITPILLLEFINGIREDFYKPKLYDRAKIINKIINKVFKR